MKICWCADIIIIATATRTFCCSNVTHGLWFYQFPKACLLGLNRTQDIDSGIKKLFFSILYLTISRCKTPHILKMPFKNKIIEKAWAKNYFLVLISQNVENNWNHSSQSCFLAKSDLTSFNNSIFSEFPWSRNKPGKTGWQARAVSLSPVNSPWSATCRLLLLLLLYSYPLLSQLFSRIFVVNWHFSGDVSEFSFVSPRDVPHTFGRRWISQETYLSAKRSSNKGKKRAWMTYLK